MEFPWRRKQHNYELPSESRIEEVIKSAKHVSVTRNALTETRRSRHLRSDTGWIHQRPLISYLDSDEQPHFILESTQPVQVEHQDEVEEIAPTPPYRSLACITDRRVLLLVGRKPENWTVSLAFDELDDFGLKPGEQDPQKAEGVGITTTFTPILRLQKGTARYSFIDETSLPLKDVRSLGELMKAHFSEDRWEYEAFWESAERVRKQKIKKRAERQQKRLQREKEERREREERWQEEKLRRESEKREREAKKRERQVQLETLAEKSSSTSVTPDRLDPIFDHLFEGESVDFILFGGQRGAAIFSPGGEAEVTQTTNQNWTAITPSRILFSREPGDVDEISYDVLETARIGRVPQGSLEHWEEPSNSPALILAGDEFIYFFEAATYTLPHLHELAEVVREYIDS